MIPPSIVSEVPVVQPDSSDARNSAARAMSSGDPRRFMRVFCRHVRDGPGRVRKRRGRVPDERRVHRARAEHVDADVRAVVDGRLPDQGQQRALGGAVGGVVREPLQRRDRPADDHRAPAARLHDRQARAKQVEHRVEVDRECLPPGVERHAGDGAEPEHAGEADDRVEAAELAAAPLHQPVAGLGKADIAGHEHDPAAVASDLRLEGASACLVAAARHDGGALAREEQGRRAAHAAGGPGDDRRPPVHPLHGGDQSTPRRPPRLENPGALTQELPFFTRESSPGYPTGRMREGQATLRRLATPSSRRAAWRVPAGRPTRPRGAPCHAFPRPYSRTPFRHLRRGRSRDGAPGGTATRARWSRRGAATARTPLSRVASRRPWTREHRPLRCRPARGAARPYRPAPGPVDCSSTRPQASLVERPLAATAAGARASCSAISAFHHVVCGATGGP